MPPYYNNILDIITKLSGDNENLVYNEAIENKIDDLVSNTSEQPKLSGDNENFVYNEAFVLKYYVLRQ